MVQIWKQNSDASSVKHWYWLYIHILGPEETPILEIGSGIGTETEKTTIWFDPFWSGSDSFSFW